MLEGRIVRLTCRIALSGILTITVNVAAERANADPRETLLRTVGDMPTGARLVETNDGAVLTAAATVPIPEDPRQDRAFGLAATAAMIEARAEAALFLGGSYATDTESRTSRRSGPEGDVSETWVRTHIASLAGVKLAAGETLQLTRNGRQVRVLLAWGNNAAASNDGVDAIALGALADDLAGANDVPSRSLQWVKDARGREGLRVVVTIFPEGGLKPLCPKPDGPPCGACQRCREDALEAILQATVGGWAREGDVGVARSLTRIATRTKAKAKDGAESLVRASKHFLDEGTTVEATFKIPGDFFSRSTCVFRHTPARSVCAAFVPAEATLAHTNPSGCK